MLSSSEMLEELIDKSEEKQGFKENLYEILGMTNMEIKHSNYLAYLFNENINGNIGRDILYSFLMECNIEPYLAKYSLELKDLFNPNVKLEISRENLNIDILIKFYDLCTVIIENKIWADEHGKQLFNYESVIKEKIEHNENGFNNIVKNPICLYLTPDGKKAHEEGSEHWIPVSYSVVYKIIKSYQKNEKFKKLSIKQQMMLKDYQELLGDFIMNKSENENVKIILEDFYTNNEKKKMMENIIQYVPNYKHRAEIIRQACEKNNIVNLNGSTAYINFLPQSFIDEYEKKGLGKSFIYFQLSNNSSFRQTYIQCYFDLSSKEASKNVNYVKMFFGKFYNGQKTLSKDLTTDRSLGVTIQILSYDDECRYTEEEKEQKIKEFFQNFNSNLEVCKLLDCLKNFDTKTNA